MLGQCSNPVKPRCVSATADFRHRRLLADILAFGALTSGSSHGCSNSRQKAHFLLERRATAF